MIESITPKNLTDEQINMLVSGSESFFRTALFAEEKFKTLFPRLDNLYPLETFGVSKANLYHVYGLMNAMSANFGMAFELKLKCIQYFTLKGILHDHSLENLLDCLNPITQDVLSEYYQKWITQCPYEKKFIKYVHSGNQIVLPSITSIGNFKCLLKFLDQIGLYDQRFAFENFEPSEWEHVVLPSAFSGLIVKLNDFILKFGIPSSPSESQSYFVPHIIFDAEDYNKKWGVATFQRDPSSGNLNSISGQLASAQMTDGKLEMNPIIEYNQDMLKQKDKKIKETPSTN